MHHQQVHDCLFLISQTSLKPIQAILILDADGKRICAKYYNSHYATEKKQLEFEKKLYIKTKNSNTRTDADIAMLGSSIIVFKNCADVSFCVVGEEDGNELIYSCVLDGLLRAVSGLLRGQVDKRSLLEHLSSVLLSLDEVVDGGIILEVDPLCIANRVLMKGGSSEPAPKNLKTKLGGYLSVAFR